VHNKYIYNTHGKRKSFNTNKITSYIIQIYHVWEGYLRKIPVERRKISRAEWRVKFSLNTGIFRKYSSQT
jgi:hypothetical protein